MEVRATAKYVRVQPRKVRIIADEIRGKDAEHCVALLRYHPSKSAKALQKVLISAMANAKENHGLSPDELRISTIMVDEGPRLKRMRARAMGRGSRIIKKTSHITVGVEDHESTPTVKPHGTKAKPRPTFAVATKGRRKGAPKPAAAVETVAPVEEPIIEAPVEVEVTPVVEDVQPVTPEETPAAAVEAEGTDTAEVPTTEEPADADKEAE